MSILRFQLIFILFCACSFNNICKVCSSSATNFNVINNRIIDETGRESYFHGLNVIYKSAPYLPMMDEFNFNLSFVDEDMELLNSLGMNAIRLGVMWPGVMPEKNIINQTYIDEAAKLISNAYENYNIYTLVDAHQDVLSETFCGEGAPLWAMQPNHWNFPQPMKWTPYKVPNDTHIPTREDCLSKQWAEYYPTAAVGSAFEAIYTNQDGLRDSYAQYFGAMASSFKDVSGIIGFELMNEPWAGNVYRNPLLVWPGQADKRLLQPFYDALVPSIYGNDSERLVFFESVTWTGEWNSSWTETGFTNVPGGNDYSNKSVFSFHYYKVPNFGSIVDYFSERTRDGIKWNSTSFLTEFNFSGVVENDFISMSETMDLCDKHLISWIGWEYKPYAGCLPDGTCTGCALGLFNADGNVNNITAKAATRTYAMKVAGHTEFMKFDSTSGKFTLTYDINTNLIQDPTVIYWSQQYWYPNGYDIEISDNDLIANVSGNGKHYIYLYNTQDSSMNGQTVTVKISPQ